MYFYLEIPLLCIGITLWIFCCYYVKQRREDGQEELRFRRSPSVYVIPLYDEEQGDTYEDCYGQPYREPTESQQEMGLPPPYRLEPPSYMDGAPPSYSDLYRDSSGRTVT